MAHQTADIWVRQISKPSLSLDTGAPLFFQAPPQLHEATKPNLTKRVADLVAADSSLTVTDPNLPFDLTVSITYSEA